MARNLLAVALLLCLCADASALIRQRTFKITDQGNQGGFVTQTVGSPATFSYDDASWADNVLTSGELLTTFQVTNDDGRYTSDLFTLNSITRNLGSNWRLLFFNSSGEELRAALPETDFAAPNGADLPDGMTSGMATFGLVGGMIYGNSPGDIEAMVGTAAVPEPSAFLLVGLVAGGFGIRRWRETRK